VNAFVIIPVLAGHPVLPKGRYQNAFRQGILIPHHKEQIDVADFLTIAERVLGVDGKSLRKAARLGQAESALAAPFAGFGSDLSTRIQPNAPQSSARESSEITLFPMATSGAATSAC
jgi:hypothetical protein